MHYVDCTVHTFNLFGYEQLAVKSLSGFLAADSSSTLLPDCQPSLAPCPSPGGLHNPSLPAETSPPSHSPSQPTPFPSSNSESHSSHSPDFPHPSLSSRAQSPTQHSSSLAPSSQTQSRSLMASPKMGVSATTTTSSSSSSSSCAPPHPGSPSPVPEGPPSPITPAPSPGDPPRTHLSIAVILEELRVLQQRQIYQMQMTEEICKQVLQLGGVTCGLDSPPLPQLCLEGSESTSGAPLPLTTQASAPPLLACFPSLVPQSVSKPKTPHPMSQVLRPLKPQYDGIGGTGARVYPGSNARASSSSSSSTSSSSSVATTAVSHYPLSLSLGMPPRYLHEKSPNTTSANAATLPFFTPPLPASASMPSTSQEPQQFSSGSGTSSGPSLGRPSHACRFCGKLFSSDSSLQIHLRSHTGERPYQCPVCLSRFTTRGNLKVHFLRHREQNPELSLSLLPPSLFGAGAEQNQPAGGSGSSMVQKRRKRRSEDELFGEASEGVSGSGAFPLGTSPSARPPPASLPLPPSVDLALLSTAHSLLQLNRAAAAAAAAAAVSSSSSAAPSSCASSTSLTSSLLSAASSSSSAMSSTSTSSVTGLYKGAKRFDENTPPHPAIHPHSAYSQLAHLPKILFPTAPSQHHHPSLALLRPPAPPPPGSHLAAPHPQLTFPFSPFPKAQASSSPSSSSSDTSKLQRLVEKLEKDPQKLEECSSSGSAEAAGNSAGTTAGPFGASSSVSSHSAVAAAGFSREMMAALGMSGSGSAGGGAAVVAGSLGVMGGSLPSLAPNQCAVCLRVLSCPRALRLHQATHLGDRPFPCKLCGRSFSTKGNLRAHQATHRSRPPARAQNSCPLCQRKFTNALVLQHHIRMHLGGQLPPDGSSQAEAPPDSSPQGEPHYFGASVGELSSSLASSMPGFSLVTAQPGGTNPFPILGASGTSLSISSTPLPAEKTSRSPSGSSSPDLIPPADLSPDPTLNPSADPPPPPGGSDPPILSVSAPISEAPPAEQKGSTTPALKGHSSAAPISPSEMSPQASVQPHNGDEDAIPPDGYKARGPEDTHDSVSPGAQSSDVLPVSSPGAKPAFIPGCDTNPCPESIASCPTGVPHPDPPDLAVEVVPEPAVSGTSTPKGDRGAAREVDPAPTTASNPRRDTREAVFLGSPPKDDGGHPKATVPEGTQLTPPSASRPPEKKTYSCSECGKEYASRSGLKGHMKHHGGVVKPTRQAPRVNAERLSATSAAPTLPPAPSGTVSFWNQYQAFLSGSGEPQIEPASSQSSASPAENAEMRRPAESPGKAKALEDPCAATSTEGDEGEAEGGPEPEGK
ncbi:sal-like protein 3 isoform X2 [Scleropages formosus]|uniref:sal-like protein 3 isoform X2 n=1 Tax=Scleropages formosus TaxID=113540 RepID=UPI0010FA9C22|nr:sal-like protein 3 isoform X2 [Scleropages formosus]